MMLVQILKITSEEAYTVADKTGAQNFFSAFNYHYLLMVTAIVMKLY
jgi:hypothetical protein